MRIVWILLVICGSARGAEVCCEPSGDCYTDYPPFDGVSWPLPNCFVPIFRLYRNGMAGGWDEITHGDTPPSYVRYDDTIFIVHTWEDTADTQWVQDAKDAFLRTGTYNVVVVDWSEGAGDPLFTQAASNVRVLGSELADMWEQLGAEYSWCIGHGLGAHACGHAAKRGAILQRITGLDPTGPNFDLESCDARADECRLHPDDSQQVDVIHTNGVDSDGTDSYGTLTALGDIDFYPNGADVQPSCPGEDPIDLGCSHYMANQYFVVSIENDCFSVSQECTDPADLPGSCGGCGDSGCPNMGASTDSGAGIYYLETDAAHPYCQG